MIVIRSSRSPVLIAKSIHDTDGVYPVASSGDVLQVAFGDFIPIVGDFGTVALIIVLLVFVCVFVFAPSLRWAWSSWSG